LSNRTETINLGAIAGPGIGPVGVTPELSFMRLRGPGAGPIFQ
jgi:hypothetical protein